MSNYYVLLLRGIPKHLESDVTELCFQHQCTGISENLQFIQRDLVYDGEILPHDQHQLSVFFESTPPEALIQDLKKILPALNFSISQEEQKDWLEEWKKGFVPFKLVGPYWVVPSWLAAPAECQFPISMDPGMAFGTGTHATTQMMAYLLYKLSKSYTSEISNWNLIDVGTGTAILAILAEKLGFPLITGIDIDPEARRVARSNIEINKSENILIRDEPLNEIKENFNVIIANIIDGVLIKLKNDLIQRVAPGGHLLVTGILLERDDFFYEKFFENMPLQVIHRLEKDEWVGYWCQRSISKDPIENESAF
ncbi:MAG TPA: 50S ribosomal protein L11 methyltransferase [Pseudobdellovibrionaceae bacterium]|nr:50S ribosomal protein L11 methyltransferase [Pseudobdellovibrionaceae bacterium]